MPDERTLMERLSQPQAPGGPTMGENTQELTRSILRNLQKILNTRVGHAAAQMDLGTPAPCEMALLNRDGLMGVVRSLKQCIEKYEPRLSGVDVTYVRGEDDILTLRFQVTAKVATSRNGATISFDTLVDANGRIKLQR
jgi:type VI secretion system protein